MSQAPAMDDSGPSVQVSAVATAAAAAPTAAPTTSEKALLGEDTGLPSVGPTCAHPECVAEMQHMIRNVEQKSKLILVCLCMLLLIIVSSSLVFHLLLLPLHISSHVPTLPAAVNTMYHRMMDLLERSSAQVSNGNDYTRSSSRMSFAQFLSVSPSRPAGATSCAAKLSFDSPKKVSERLLRWLLLSSIFTSPPYTFALSFTSAVRVAVLVLHASAPRENDPIRR
jgi:hypothetical protein